MIDKLVQAIEDENLDVARVVFYDYIKEAPKVSHYSLLLVIPAQLRFHVERIDW